MTSPGASFSTSCVCTNDYAAEALTPDLMLLVSFVAGVPLCRRRGRGGVLQGRQLRV